MRCAILLRTFRSTKIAVVLAALLFVSPSERSAAQVTPSGTQPGSEPPAVARVAGDTWLTTNASFDGVHWSSNEPARASFALWMNDGGYMPNEGRTGAAGFWTHRADCPRTFERITESCGWNLGLTVTQWKSVVVGGNTVEIDGNNAAPFGRVVNTTDGEHRFIGLMSNAFGDFSGVDVAGRASWIAGIDLTGDAFEVKRLRANPGAQHAKFGDFIDLLDVDRDGNATIAGTASASRIAQSKPGQWATRIELDHGHAVFRFPSSYAQTPVCVANSEGSARALRVVPSKSACAVSSADDRDDSTVDIVVVGNPG